MDWVLTLAGFLLIGVTLTDFFFTTLSCNGSGGITDFVNQRVLGSLLVPRSDSARVWLGAVHLVVTLATWTVLILIAGFLIYAGFDDMVVNSTTKEPATLEQRFYMTGFVFSTLGTGDFVPGSAFSRAFTVTYSILGFGLLTTAITYIINVMTAANDKKALAAYISSMGNTPLELYDYFTTTEDAQLFTDRIDNLVELLNKHINNHLCYPIVHFFLSDMRPWSASIQLASLHEATMAMRITYANDEVVMAQLTRIDRVTGRFLELARTPDRFRDGNADLLLLREQWADRVPALAGAHNTIEESKERLGALLHQFGHTWQEVY